MNSATRIEQPESAAAAPDLTLDVERIRNDFPILKQTVHGKPLAYLDNAASAQKPQAVIDAISEAASTCYANIHRGVHRLSELSTSAHEAAREKARAFLNAASAKEIVFVRNATEGINLVASSFGGHVLHKDDEILITHMEHHSNIVPWQLLCEKTGARLVVAPVTDEGELDMLAFGDRITSRTRMIAVNHVSNALGTINPVKRIIGLAHAQAIPVLLDGAQAAPHMAIDVQDLDCDFYVFSGHKVFGPCVGVLYGKKDHLEAMPPYMGGGDMILSVSFEKTLFNDIPYKFEAGTPDILGAIGLGAALDYVQSIGLDRIAAREQDLLRYATETLSAIPGLKIVGTAAEKAAVVSFVIDGIHPHDIGTILDREGVAVRTGHHCTQPLMDRFNVPATARASMAFYNTHDEIGRLASAIQKTIRMFA
ncbi:MAG: SufS family cysteine desulfurase [bacterium]|nr:SufS family cysteine desulfurase [bacterium]